MSIATLTSENSTSPIDRQVIAYEESWATETASRDEWRKLAEMVNVGVALTTVLHLAEHYWRDLVFRAVVAYDEQTNQGFLALWARWLTVTTNVLAKVDSLGKTDGGLRLTDTLREKAEQIACHVNLLRGEANAVPEAQRDWQSPRISAAVGLREMTLSEVERDELERCIEQARKNPPPMPARRMETKDASFLENK